MVSIHKEFFLTIKKKKIKNVAILEISWKNSAVYTPQQRDAAVQFDLCDATHANGLLHPSMGNIRFVFHGSLL